MNNLLGISVCTIVLALTTQAALAQNAGVAGASPAPQSGTDRDGSGIQDIIVTAQRFSESAQTISIPIAVINASDMQGISDVRQLQTLNPGIQLGVAGGVVQTFVRGVGSPNAQASQESSIAYNADGVFLFSPAMITPLMYDLDRIEVLKGPQGTLYGRNASGGAVNIITRGAQIGKVEGLIEGEVGNYDLRRVTGAVNLPITNTLAIRFAGQHVEHDGYLSDGTDDQDLSSGRVRLRWEPSTDVTLQLGFDVARARAIGAGSSVNPNPTSDKFVGALDPRLDTGPFFLGGTSLLSFPPNPAPYSKLDQRSVNAQLDVNLGFATLTVLPAYRYEHLDYLNYGPGYQDQQEPVSKQKSIETRLANEANGLKWVTGAYYFKLDHVARTAIRNETNGQAAIVPGYNLRIESYAFFGEATVSLTDQLRVIGGIRYSHEKTRSFGEVNSSLGPAGLLNPITGLPNVQTVAYNPFNPATNPGGELLDYPFDNGSRASAVTWKGGVEFDVGEASLLFATASRGFKGGGTYVDIPGANSSFKPEFLTAFELGSRNRFFSNTLQLNAEAFYWKLKDQQIPYVGFNNIGQVTFLTANAGRAHMYGGNVEIIWKATSNDTFRGSVEYVKSEYDSFLRVVPSAVVLTTTRCNVTGYAGPTSFAPAVVDCAGLPVLRSPKWAGSASYEHRFDFSDASDLALNANMTFSSGRYLSPAYTEIFRQKANALFNASATYTLANKNVSITAWIRNIANSRVMVGGEQFVNQYSRPTLQPPRTYGISARYAF